eukprot:265022_1
MLARVAVLLSAYTTCCCPSFSFTKILLMSQELASWTMPWTSIHPFYGWFIIYSLFKVNLHSSAVFWSILWGSIFPDLPHHLFFLYHIFVCDNVYLTNFGCNQAVMTNAASWAHSLPLALIITIISYLMYYRAYHQSKHRLKPHPKIMDPLHVSAVHSEKEERNDDLTQYDIVHKMDQNEKKQAPIQMDESAQLLGKDSTYYVVDNPNIEILSVKTYDSKNSIGPRERSRRYTSFVSTHGGWLTCKNCWCDAHGFWLMMTYFFMSTFMHSTMDFVMHHSTAHSEFLPFTWWIWRSPISYFEEEYYGYIVGPIVCGIAVPLSVWIFDYKRMEWELHSKLVYYIWIVVFIAVNAWFCYEIVYLISNTPN